MDKRTQILKALDDIEHLSGPSVTALNVLNNEEVNRAELIRTLELDPALTTNLLRFANSAFFGYARTIHSVNEAVVRLGLKAIRRMVHLSISSGLAQQSVNGYDLPPRALWKHLASSAVCTEILARKTDHKPSEAAFTAALLHDIGKLVLSHYLEVDAAPILALSHEEQIPFNEAETRVLGISHAEIGAELLTRWNLPENMVEAVRWHHDPEGFPGDPQIVDLVHLGDAISVIAGTGLGIDGLSYTVSRAAEKRIGLTARLVEGIICELQDETAKLEEVV